MMNTLFDHLTAKLGQPDPTLTTAEIEAVIREHTDLAGSSPARRTTTVL